MVKFHLRHLLQSFNQILNNSVSMAIQKIQEKTRISILPEVSSFFHDFSFVNAMQCQDLRKISFWKFCTKHIFCVFQGFLFFFCFQFSVPPRLWRTLRRFRGFSNLLFETKTCWLLSMFFQWIFCQKISMTQSRQNNLWCFWRCEVPKTEGQNCELCISFLYLRRYIFFMNPVVFLRALVERKQSWEVNNRVEQKSQLQVQGQLNRCYCWENRIGKRTSFESQKRANPRRRVFRYSIFIFFSIFDWIWL